LAVSPLIPLAAPALGTSARASAVRTRTLRGAHGFHSSGWQDRIAAVVAYCGSS